MDYNNWTKENLTKEISRLNAELTAFQEAASSINLLEMLHHAQTDFIAVDSETNIFHRMLDNFLKVTKSRYGFIDEMFYTADGSMYLEARSITNIAWDDESRKLYEKLVSGEVKFDNLNSLYGEVMKTGKRFIANDAPNDPRRCGIPKGHPALKAFLGLPLHAGGEFVGMIGLANAPDGYNEEMVSRIEPLIRICAIIMHSFKIDQKRKQSITNLEAQQKELKEFNRMAIGREERMIGLKREINELSRELGRPESYDLSGL